MNKDPNSAAKLAPFTCDELDAMEEKVQAECAAELATSKQQWGALYAEWLGHRATFAAGGLGDGECDRLTDRESEIMKEMIVFPAPNRVALLQKIAVLQEAMEPSDWADRRDLLLLASIKADVEDQS